MVRMGRMFSRPIFTDHKPALPEDISKYLCRFFDVHLDDALAAKLHKRKANMYEYCLAKAMPFVVTAAMAATQIQQIMQRALEQG